MKTTVQRWGNSLAVRIPKSFASEIEVGEGDQVEMAINEGRLVIAPKPISYDLCDLVNKISSSNLHQELAIDGPEGREAW